MKPKLSTFFFIDNNGRLIFYLHYDSFQEITGFDAVPIPSIIDSSYLIYPIYA